MEFVEENLVQYNKTNRLVGEYERLILNSFKYNDNHNEFKKFIEEEKGLLSNESMKRMHRMGSNLKFDPVDINYFCFIIMWTVINNKATYSKDIQTFWDGFLLRFNMFLQKRQKEVIIESPKKRRCIIQ